MLHAIYQIKKLFFFFGGGVQTKRSWCSLLTSQY